MKPTLQDVLDRAIQQGLLPAGSTTPAHEGRPWPVVLLIALGAWLAVVPLLAVVGMLLGDFIVKGPGPYLVGLLMLAGALVVLRSHPLPVLVEQLALPALLVGGGALGAGLFRDISATWAAALLALTCAGVAAAVPRPWLRALLGVASSVFFGLACMPRALEDLFMDVPARAWWALHAMAALWLAMGVLQGRVGAKDRALLEPFRGGWLIVTLAGLATWSGQTLLVGASVGGTAGAVAMWLLPGGAGQAMVMQAASAVLTLAAAAWAARQWPALRQPWCAAAALVLAALAGVMPALGAVWLALAVSCTAARWRLASAAALAAAWVLGAFYYALSWPLQHKALLLLAAGALLGALAWWGLCQPRERESAAPGAAAPPLFKRTRVGLALAVLAVLGVVNGGIWQKETLIRDGQPFFVPLAPVDPRSLMQGDYMQLRFALPSGANDPQRGLLRASRPSVLAKLDAQGVATLRLATPDSAPRSDELRIELTPKGGDWVLVTDAWFFAEGQAERWAQARYGEFRVDGQGRALLVGLRDAKLQAL